MTAPTIDLATLTARLQPIRTRTLIAIAGPPGSGKSTVAEALAAALNTTPGHAAILPMDGYHYDDTLLHALHRHPRKGASDTFDADGLRVMLQRLRDNTDPAIIAPIFDRDIEIARAGARLIPQTAPVIIVEGNYLLLNQSPWHRLKPLFDLTIQIVTPEDTLRQRLTARWQGYNLSPEDIRRKVEDLDLPNGRALIAGSAPADYTLLN